MKTDINPSRSANINFVGNIINGRSFLVFRSQDNLRDVLRVMRLNNAGAAGVVDGDERLIGLLTEQEILRRLFDPISPQAAIVDLARVTVGEVMIFDPVCLNENMDVEDAVGVLQAHKFRFMPVVTDEGELTGIVSERELFFHAHEKAQRELDRRDSLLSYFMHHEPYGMGYGG